jgi:MFS family permease
MAADTGWNRTALAGVKSLGRISEAAVSPFLGPVVDRFGVRWMMVAGGVISGLAMIMVSTIDQLWQLYAYVGVVAPIGGVCLGGWIASVAVANWFVVKRGRAVGVANMGMSLGTTILPLLVSALIEAWGWRAAWVALGVAVVLLSMPAGVFVRRRPEDLGLLPDGRDPSKPWGEGPMPPRRQAAGVEDAVWTRGEIIRSPLLWTMVFSWGFAQFAFASTNIHVVPFFQDLGYPLVVAAGALSLRSALSLVGNPLWGLALERVPLKSAASLAFVSTGLGLGAWLLPASPGTLLAGVILFGLGAGCSQVAGELIWASFYGRLSLGTVRGVSYPLQSLFASAGPLVVGLMYDFSGSYHSAFAMMMMGCLLSAGLVQLARPPRRREASPARPEP